MTNSKKNKGPQFLQYCGPIMTALRKLGGSGSPNEVEDLIATDLKISEKEQSQITSSGNLRFKNEVAWARFYLAREGLLDSSERGIWSLTKRGRLAEISPKKAYDIFLKVRTQFVKERRLKGDKPEEDDEPIPQAGGERIGNYQAEVIKRMLSLPPAGFERLSNRLLREAGFVQVTVTGQSGDEGIDGYGTLQVNPLVSFKVLFQCKRYRKAVAATHVRDFRGAMAGRAVQGIIITTGTFTAEARKEASRDGVPPIELIDGGKLVQMLESLKLGLRPVTTYEIDDSFFEGFSRE